MIFHERAYAKLNLVLQVGEPRADGMHPLCSLFASIDLADELHGGPTGFGADSVECPGVSGPNLALAAIQAVRERTGGALPPIGIRVAKRIPVAAGLGGGSADAAAALRLANRVAGEPLSAADLRELACTLGSDVPSQVEPGHALVQGVGEIVEPVELPPLGVVLLPDADGLSTRTVYDELDRRRLWRERLDPESVRRLAESVGAATERRASAEADRFAAALANDLQPAALALRPELARRLESLRAAGASGALVSGSGPTCFGLFSDRAAAERAAADLPGAIATQIRPG